MVKGEVGYLDDMLTLNEKNIVVIAANKATLH